MMPILVAIAGRRSGTGCKEISGGAATFLAAPPAHYYNGSKPSGWNKSMEELETDNATGIFPEGPVPYIAAFDVYGNDYAGTDLIVRAGESGYTVCGPYQAVYSSVKSHLQKVVNNGMKIAGYMRDVGTNEYCSEQEIAEGQCQRWHVWRKHIDAGRLNEEIQWAKDEIDNYNNDPVIGDSSPNGSQIAAWYNCLDDGAVDIAASSTYDGPYQQYQNAIQNYAGEKDLPLGQYGWGNSFTTIQRFMGNHNSAYVAQNYFHGAPCKGENYDHWYGRMHFTKEAQWYSRVDDEYQSKSGKPRLNLIMPGPFSRTRIDVPVFHDDADFTNNEMIYTVVSAMMSGMNGYVCYIPRQNYATVCGNTKAYENALFDKMFEFVSRFTGSDAAQALLWGLGAKPQKYDESYDPRDFHAEPITESRISGDVDFRWRNITSTQANGLPEHNPVSTTGTKVYPILHRDIQLRGNRFIFLTNGMPRQEIVDQYGLSLGSGHTDGTIRSRLSGFPTAASDREQLKVVDILSDDEYAISSSGTIDVTMNPTTARILKVTPADGWCDGDETLPPETNVTFLATPIAFQTWVNGITGSAALIDIHYSNSRISNRSRGEFYAYETADYLVFYCPDGQNMNANFDMQDFANVCTVDDYLGGNYPGLPVGANQSIAYNAAGTMGGAIYSKTA